MDDLKSFGKNEQEIELLAQMVRIYSEDIARKLGKIVHAVNEMIYEMNHISNCGYEIK